MEIKDRAFWFFRNLLVFIVSLPFLPLFILWCILKDLVIVLFITDGSECLGWFWEWNWKKN